jgi:hypothetical protein
MLSSLWFVVGGCFCYVEDVEVGDFMSALFGLPGDVGFVYILGAYPSWVAAKPCLEVVFAEGEVFQVCLFADPD